MGQCENMEGQNIKYTKMNLFIRDSCPTDEKKNQIPEKPIVGNSNRYDLIQPNDLDQRTG